MHKKSLLYIALAGVLWGMTGIFVNKLKIYGFSSVQMTSVRNIVSAIAMLSYVLLTNPKGLKMNVKEIGLFVLSGAAVFFTSASYYISISMTTPATAVVLMYTAPIFVMFVSVFFMGEKLTLSKIIAVFLTFAGCGLISGIVGGGKFNLEGCLFGLCSGVCYALYNILAKIEMQRKNDAVVATTYCFITAGILGIIMGNPVEIAGYISKDVSGILPWAIGIGVLTGALPYFLYTLASKKLPASVASAMSSVEPLTAAIISFTVFGEKVGVQSVLGITVILAAVILLSRSDEKKNKTSKKVQ